MNLPEIKKIIQEERSKIIIADETGPSMVIMSYDDYKKLKGSSSVKEANNHAVNRVNSKELEAESLHIDDLPF